MNKPVLDPKYKIQLLPNNLQIILMPLSKMHAVTVVVLLKAGSRLDPKDKTGLAHFTEHMLMQGTKSYPSRQKLYGAVRALGSQFRIGTSKELILLNMRLLPEHLSTGVKVVSQILHSPTFPQERLDQVQAVILREMARLNERPPILATQTFYSMLWPTDNLGQQILGTIKSVQATKLLDIKNFHARLFAPQNTVVGISGNFTVETARGLIKEWFESWDGESKDKTELPQDVLDIGSQKESTLQGAYQQAQVLIGVPTVSYFSNKRYAVSLIRNLLASPNSPLTEKIREELGLTYKVTCRAGTFSNAGYLWVRAGVAHDKIALVADTMRCELQRLGNKRIKEEVLEKIKQRFRASFLFALDKPAGHIRAFAHQLSTKGKIEVPSQYLSKIETVTPRNIQEAAQELFQPQNLKTVVITK